jgi:hypothetical protein
MPVQDPVLTHTHPRQEARTFEEAGHVCRAWGGHVLSFQVPIPNVLENSRAVDKTVI